MSSTTQDSSNPQKHFDEYGNKDYDDVIIEKVNLIRATFKEAQEFQERLSVPLLRNRLKIIIDLSKCEYIDSTFLGALVVSTKRIEERGGELKFIEPKSSALYLFRITGLYQVLEFYDNLEDALESFRNA